MALTTESWNILQEKLKANADYQYLINYNFNYLYKAHEPQANPHRIWEFFDKDSEWGLLNYLYEQPWFLFDDWNIVICQNGKVDYIVEKLVKYLTVVCKFELIAKAVSGKTFYSGSVTSGRNVIKTVFIDKEFVMVFDRNRIDTKGTYPGIHFGLYARDFEQMSARLIEVDMTSIYGYEEIDSVSDVNTSLDKFKLRTIPDYLKWWNNLQ